MRFTLGWLREHLATDADAATIAAALTRIGLEVESLTDPGAALAPFRIARVLSAERHPQADKLQVLSVDAGDGPLQVVCGAPNARAGLVGVFGAPGAYVPGSKMTLKVAAIRGVESNGMMCSFRELELGDEHDGIIELPEDAPVGARYAAWAGLDDPLFDVAITPNRQDCMGVRGIARDLAAAGLGTLGPLAEVYRMTSLAPIAGDEPAPEARTDDPKSCPAFFAQVVSGVTNGASPEWMRRKLAAIGQKPISMLVDVTNFVSLDLGRPLHVYDRAKLSGPLVARRAKDGEEMLALNGRTYTLDAGMTVIADDMMVHDIGGIMGGAHSGVSEGTTDVLIECAYFDPDAIARTGQKLALTSDARQRFERGVDPAFLDEGLAIATRLVLDHCGGRASAVTRAGEPPLERRTIAYDPSLCARLGGLEVEPKAQAAILVRLGFGVADDWTVTVPSWRRDVEGMPDLVEEVIRIEGIDRIPSVALPRAEGVARPTATPEQTIERRIRRAAAARGLHEAVTWSFVSEREAAPFGGAKWTLANPISEELKAMRPSLLPGLIAAAARNLARGAEDVRLFEVGRRYEAVGERATLGLVKVLAGVGLGWRGQERAAWESAKEDVVALVTLVSGEGAAKGLRVEAPASAWYHPGRSGRLLRGRDLIAEFGELYPTLARGAGIRQQACGAEIFLDALTPRPQGRRKPYAPSALQAVRRDFAFVLDADASAGALDKAIRTADRAVVTDVNVFDRYELADGARSLALRVTLQPAERSFNDEELAAISARIVAAAAKVGAKLRV